MSKQQDETIARLRAEVERLKKDSNSYFQLLQRERSGKYENKVADQWSVARENKSKVELVRLYVANTLMKDAAIARETELPVREVVRVRVDLLAKLLKSFQVRR